MTNWYKTLKLYLSETTGETPVKFNNEVIIDSVKGLERACKFDHTATKLKNNYRKDANFLSVACVMVDFDNDGKYDKLRHIDIDPTPEQWLTPEKLSERLPGVVFYAVTSRNNNKVKHPGEPGERSARQRYHVYFPLKAEIKDKAILAEIKDKIATVSPEIDSGAKDATRFFYGHDNPVATLYTGDYDISEYFANHPEIIPQKQKATDKPERLSSPKAVNGDFDDAFKQANISIILDAIPADCSEKEWSSVCHALKREGFSFELFDQWSATGAKYNQKDGGNRTGQRMTLYKWNHKRVSSSNNIGFGWLYKTALSYDPSLRDRITKTGDFKPGSRRRNKQQKLTEYVDTETGEVISMTEKQPEQVETVGDIVIHQAKEIKTEKKATEEQIPPLETFSADFFNNTNIEEPTPIIDQVLYSGLGMLGSPAKMGKSYMMLQLAVSVATGSPFMGFKVERPGEVLYLDLQGTKARTKQRLFSMGYKSMPEGITLAYKARNTDNGFIAQVEQWITSKERKRKPSLIIIDMLEQVKGSQRRTEDAYRSDNRILEPLHDLALKHDISVFTVLHTRKGNTHIAPDDPFNEIIGSTGQFGSADCAWMILGKRDEERKRFSTICRDNDDGQQDFEAVFKDHRWNVTGTVEEIAEKKATEEYNNNPVVFTLRTIIDESGGGWGGTLSELITEVAQRTSEYPAVTPEKMKKIINSLAYRLSCEGIYIQYPGKNGGQYGRRYKFYRKTPEQLKL